MQKLSMKHAAPSAWYVVVRLPLMGSHDDDTTHVGGSGCLATASHVPLTPHRGSTPHRPRTEGHEALTAWPSHGLV